MKKKCFLISLVLVLMIFVFGGCKNNTDPDITTEITTELTTILTTEETTEKKEAVTTTEAITEKKSTEAQTKKNEGGNTEYVTTVTTTKKQETTTQATKPITTTKPVATTKAPETTKKPTTTKAEYYPALTAADMEELKRYAINYIESKGYRADPDIRWDNAGYYVVDGTRDDIESYGDRYKKNGGINPLQEAKNSIKGKIDWHIEDWERANGPDSIYGMYPLVRRTSNSWQWTIGYW